MIEPSISVEAGTAGQEEAPSICGETGTAGQEEAPSICVEPGAAGQEEALSISVEPGTGEEEAPGISVEPGTAGEEEDPSICGETGTAGQEEDPGICGETGTAGEEEAPGICGEPGTGGQEEAPVTNKKTDKVRQRNKKKKTLPESQPAPTIQPPPTQTSTRYKTQATQTDDELLEKTAVSMGTQTQTMTWRNKSTQTPGTRFARDLSTATFMTQAVAPRGPDQSREQAESRVPNHANHSPSHTAHQAASHSHQAQEQSADQASNQTQEQSQSSPESHAASRAQEQAHHQNPSHVQYQTPSQAPAQSQDQAAVQASSQAADQAPPGQLNQQAADHAAPSQSQGQTSNQGPSLQPSVLSTSGQQCPLQQEESPPLCSPGSPDQQPLEKESDLPPRLNKNFNRDPNELYVLTWNIDGLDGEDIEDRFPSLIRYIMRIRADVVLLQELIPPIAEGLEEILQDYEFIFGNSTSYFTAILLLKSRVKLLQSTVVNYPTTEMGRNLLMAQVSFSGHPVWVMTSHLESCRESSQERLNQMRRVWKRMREAPDDHHVIFGGDTNLRDREVKWLRGVPEGLMDVWELIGQPESCAYTWDTVTNNNKDVDFKARLRFDRVYMRSAKVGSKISEVKMKLVGKEQLKCGRFTSDHWGILCKFSMEPR